MPFGKLRVMEDPHKIQGKIKRQMQKSESM